MHEFLRRGNFEPTLERVNWLLKARRDAMLEALERHMPDDAAWSRPEGGYFIWLDVPSGPETAELLSQAEEAGVTFVKGTDFFVPGGGGDRALRIGVSVVSREAICDGVAGLARLLSGARRRRRRSSCASRMPAVTPRPSASRTSQTSDTLAVANTKWTCTCLRFSSTNAIAYATSSPSAIRRA